MLTRKTLKCICVSSPFVSYSQMKYLDSELLVLQMKGQVSPTSLLAQVLYHSS